MSVQSLRGFRKLLRASRTVFGKDRDGLLTARAFIRQQFEENRNETDPEVLGAWAAVLCTVTFKRTSWDALLRW